MIHFTFTRGLRALSAGLGLLCTLPSFAAPLSFMQMPAGSSAREPAPNVIITVDDSGSMGWDVNGCPTPLFDPRYGGTLDPARPPGAPACPAANVNPNPARITALRNALVNTFGDPAAGTNGIIPDDRIRLGWQVMWDNGAALRPIGQQNAQNTLVAGAVNSVKRFTGTHRTNFNNFINSLTAWNGTPSHLMMSNVNAYMSTGIGTNSPFASDPGTTGAPYLSCRRTYHILMTDGAWNSANLAPTNAGNADGTNRTLPDGTPYVATPLATATPQTRVYRDANGGNTGTLADWAFTNWATDFQPTLTNNIRTITAVSSNEVINGITALQPYWNPRNDPSTWQGVTQHTIGFGRAATTWPVAPAWDNVSDSNYSGDYSGLVNGTTTWPNIMPVTAANGADNPDRAMDLWHMALNGRGRYYPARTPQALDAAFQDILSNILAQNARPLVSIATSSTRASAGGFAYVAGYDSQSNWKGSLAAYRINSKTSMPSTTATWKAETLLDAADFSVTNRVVLTHNGTQGVAFRWNNLTNNQKLAIQGTDVAGTGSARISYLRGDRSLEGSTGYMRTRSSRLGDIVNSNIWHTGAPSRMAIDLPGHAAFRSANANRVKTVWVGANDGMLHGFNGQTGQEVLAYVPLGLYGTVTSSPLRDLTRPSYSHRYYVDGHPFTGDVNINTTGAPDWRTLLVSSLGAGGKGFFVLDVTNAANFVDPGNAASNVVVMDKTVTTNADIGHIFAAPVVDELTRSRSEQIVRVNDSGTSGYRWAVILGNGYNSTNERPVLLIQYLDGTRALRTIVANATTGQANGLGAPRTVDLNGNGTVDLVYAGDLKGNLWKFDLTSSNPSNWKVAFSGNPLYTARDSSGNTQPITAAPIWKMGYDGTGIQVLFGTGQNIVATELGASSVQTVYSIWDQSQYYWTINSGVTGTDTTRITGTRESTLVQQTQKAANAGDVFFSTSTNGVAYSRSNASAPRGWYFDLPASRERVLNHPTVFERNLIRVSSAVPTASAEGETCDLSTLRGAGYLSIFDIYSGKPPTHDVFGEGNGNRVIYGSGDYATVEDKQRNKETIIDPGATCEGTECECIGAGCGCSGNSCGSPGRCGGFKGKALETCLSGFNGARADWREIR